MKILMRSIHNNRIPLRAVKSFMEGVRVCGDKILRDRRPSLSGEELRALAEGYDMAVIWGTRPANWRRVADFRKLGKDVLVLEMGFIGDREEWIACGWNDINGRAEYVMGEEPRWERLWGKEILKPWSTGYDHVLLVGQVPMDMNTSDCKNLQKWYQAAADHFRRRKIPVKWRRHPHDIEKPRIRRGECPKHAELDESRTLQEAMENALVVTYSSNTGVEAALAGRPVIAMNRTSMIHGLASGKLDEVRTFDRVPWLHRMAYCQWHLDELKDGTAWRHLRRRWLDNKVWQTIRHRRSCRRFIDKPIPPEFLQRLLEAGMWAPSGYNSQNFRFLLIDDKQEVERLGKIKTPEGLTGKAAAWIAVFSDDKAHRGFPESEYPIWSRLWTQNCSAAIENILLLAASYGLGTCWISSVDAMDGTRFLHGRTWRELFKDYDIPPDHSVHGLILLGWPKETQDGSCPAGDRRHGGKLVESRKLDDFLIGRKA